MRFKDVRIYRTEESTGEKDIMELDLTVDEMEIKVSVLWMLEGKGLVESVNARGIRGVIDRRNCWNEYDEYGRLKAFSDHIPVPPDLRSRVEWYRGSFHFAQTNVEDVLITWYQPEPKRPLRLVVNRFHSKRLRRQWLMYDILACSEMEGFFDGRLFSLRPIVSSDSKQEIARFHMDGINVDLAKIGATGPLQWIEKGRVEVDCLMYFPKQPLNESQVKNGKVNQREIGIFQV